MNNSFSLTSTSAIWNLYQTWSKLLNLQNHSNLDVTQPILLLLVLPPDAFTIFCSVSHFQLHPFTLLTNNLLLHSSACIFRNSLHSNGIISYRICFLYAWWDKKNSKSLHLHGTGWSERIEQNSQNWSKKGAFALYVIVTLWLVVWMDFIAQDNVRFYYHTWPIDQLQDGCTRIWNLSDDFCFLSSFFFQWLHVVWQERLWTCFGKGKMGMTS